MVNFSTNNIDKQPQHKEASIRFHSFFALNLEVKKEKQTKIASPEFKKNARRK